MDHRGIVYLCICVFVRICNNNNTRHNLYSFILLSVDMSVLCCGLREGNRAKLEL